MTYLIIRRWDEDFHPTSTNRKEDLSEAIALADKIGGFYQEVDFANKNTRFMVVDPITKTVSYNQAAEDKENIQALRNERNRKLADSDWISTKSYDVGTAIPGEWKTYRQALRDLPANTADPTNITWPEEPE